MEENNQDPISRVARGDMAAFKQLFEQYGKTILNLAIRFTGSFDEAEDIVQETFVKVYLSADRYNAQGTPAAWLRKIATRLCLNRKRTARRHPVISLETCEADGYAASPERCPDVEWERKGRQRIVQAALDELPERQRMAVILQRYEGLSYARIATVMNCSVSAVESLLFRANRALVKKLQPYFEAP